MASKEVSDTILAYPHYLAMERLPVGLPAGQRTASLHFKH